MRTGRGLLLMFFTLILFCVNAAWADDSFKEFPDSIKQFIFFEQKLIGLRNTQADTLSPEYQPEQSKVFHLETYWIDADRFDLQKDDKATPAEIRKHFFREYKGKTQVLFSVHPDEKEFFRDITANAERGPVLISTASASPRSLFTTVPSSGNNFSFLNKLSINKRLGGNIRLIHKMELARSLFVSNLLSQEKNLPTSFAYYPEFMVMIPKGWEKGGTILRSIPKEVQSGKVTHIPFFAIFAEQPDGSRPLILDMVEKSGLSFNKFYHEKIIRPFLEQWLDLALNHGITTEPHGQNLLLEIGKDGLPTGRFVHRDFGGFTIDLELREKLGLKSPKLVEVNGYKVKYDINDVGYSYKSSIDLYFANIVSNLGLQYEKWYKKGWVKNPGDEKSFHKDLVQEVEKAFYKFTGQKMKLDGWLANMMEPMLKARGAANNSCSRVFGR